MSSAHCYEIRSCRRTHCWENFPHSDDNIIVIKSIQLSSLTVGPIWNSKGFYFLLLIKFVDETWKKTFVSEKLTRRTRAKSNDLINFLELNSLTVGGIMCYSNMCYIDRHVVLAIFEIETRSHCANATYVRNCFTTRLFNIRVIFGSHCVPNEF